MIRVESITINEFRGVRDLTLDCKGKNYAICGPNGTGKSGIVDALEFAITGQVSRLSGEGKGEVSLKEHGPHVDIREHPDKAKVSVVLDLPSLGKKVTIERTAKSPLIPTITPPDADVVALLKKIEDHPEIVLSRRELIRFVLATPGDRAHEVQALLRLDRVENVRLYLQRIAKAEERQADSLAQQVKGATDKLIQALKIKELKADLVLAAANEQRSVLGLAALTEFTSETSLKEGIAAPTAAKPQSIVKVQCQADIDETRKIITEGDSQEICDLVLEAVAEAGALSSDPAGKAGVTEEKFYEQGLGLLVDEECPFCDTRWDVEELRQHVQAKLDGLKQFSQKRKTLAEKTSQLASYLRQLKSALDSLTRQGAMAKPPIDMAAVTTFTQTCGGHISDLDNLVPFESAITALKAIGTVPAGVTVAVTALETHVKALPDASKSDTARDFLTVAQERLETLQEHKRDQKTAKEKAALARTIHETYVTAGTRTLTDLYEKVQEKFVQLYRYINRTDEDGFTAKLVPSAGKLGFDVEFYGRGFFPPGAYHSEGHQDGMGLCLYLALMRYTQGNDFTLAIFDDVLMSVDTAHRREVCTLLKQEFKDTQFILTTHDTVWLQHMKTEGLITSKSGARFRSWSVEQGPVLWLDRDVWAEIDGYLAINDVRSGAALLRHYLEYHSAELCHYLRAPVGYRSDGQYQLGELLPSAINHFRDLLKKAKGSANSWNQRDKMAAIAARESAFETLVKASKAEEWQVNAAIHYNSWSNLDKADFAPVAKSFQSLLTGFNCDDCREILYASPERETAEMLRCDCGTTTLNLLLKRG